MTIIRSYQITGRCDAWNPDYGRQWNTQIACQKSQSSTATGLAIVPRLRNTVSSASIVGSLPSHPLRTDDRENPKLGHWVWKERTGIGVFVGVILPRQVAVRLLDLPIRGSRLEEEDAVRIERLNLSGGREGSWFRV